MPSGRFVLLGLKAAFLVGCGAACASCAEDYLARRDTLALGDGDAVRADMARQAIDPWPAASFDTVLDSNGERLQHAMEQYRNPSTNVPGANPAPLGSTVPVIK